MSTPFETGFDDDDIIEASHVKQYANPINELESGAALFREASNASGVYEVDFTTSSNPDGHSIDALTQGQMIVFKASHNSPASATLKVLRNSSPGYETHPLYLGNAQAGAGDILDDQMIMVVFNETSTPRFDVVGISRSSTGPVAVADGGTGASNAGSARTNLGAQAQDDALDQIAGLSMAKGDVLVHNGTAVTKLGSGTNGQVLSADSAEAAGLKWVEQTPPGASDLDDLSDVVITSPTSGDILRHNGTAFVNAAPDIADISDLQNELDGKADVGHTHPASDIASGTLPVARGGTGADLSATGGAGQVLKQSSSGGSISVGALSATDMPSGIDAAKIGGGAVSNAEFGYLEGVTSSIQSQLDGKQSTDSDLSGMASISVARGTIPVGNSMPAWSGLAKGTANQALRVDSGGNDPGWGTLQPAGGGTGQTSLGSAIGALLDAVGSAEEGQVLTFNGTTYEWSTPNSGGELMIGDFEETFRTTPKDGFLECNGTAVSQTTYAGLLDAIGFEYHRDAQWTQATTGGGESGHYNGALAYGGGKWLHMRNSSTYYLSTDDGRTWTSQTAPTTFRCVGYGNGLWIAGAGSVLYSSTTGLTGSWTSRYSGTYDFYTIQWNGSEYVGLGDSGYGYSGATQYARSTNGTSWTGTYGSFGGLTSGRDLIWFNSLWLYCADTTSGTMIVSAPANSTTFTSRLTGSSSMGGCSIAKNAAGTVCVFLTGNSLYSSTDGTSWTSRSLPSGTAIYTAYSGYSRVVFDTIASVFRIFALSESNQVGHWISSDGATWQYKGDLAPAGTVYQPLTLREGNGVLVGHNNNSNYGFYWENLYDPSTEFPLPLVADGPGGAKTHIKAQG